MLNFLPAKLIGFISFSLYILNTIFWLLPILVFSLFKALIPLTFSKKIFSYLLDLMASNWVATNSIIQKLFTKTNIVVTGLEALKINDWYLVLANHQSWVDIVVLQRALHGNIPFLKFFLKKELIYVPLLGLAWWALDFPFMKRYSQAFLKKNPHLRGKDLATTRKACAKFKHKPVSVMNFIEGTRFTQKKHDKQGSPFQHMLKPKSGGISFVLDAMGEHLTKIVDVTIYYPDGIPNFSDFIYGEVEKVHIDIQTFDIASELGHINFSDRNDRIAFQKWLTQFWHDKDARLENMRQQYNAQRDD
ncbi:MULTISPECIES: acyltransferase [Colwellia]|uniref:Acyltransferase family protein n=1 Tax=Colwellia psychrerythraea (strain 34H / ATCC BAA-681) TaxID=167879 RepID=Q47UQ3_COLP3|nr:MULTISPECIES: acyltransferase [Colwellia]AAZ28101.1 acyltransferase family protein [Colwellia psychrerythraea 34H]PKH85925.1 acyltransferase [Colwellia sp. Bg11-28]